MLRLLTLTAAVSAVALTAAAQPAPTPQSQTPPVNQSPPVRTDPQDAATQDDAQSPSSTSAMPNQTAAPAASPRGATPARPAGATTTTPTAGGNLVAVLQGTGQHGMLLQAVQTTNLTSVLEGTRPLTVFAPTDAAFNALPEAQRTALMSNPQQLQPLLLNHVFGAVVTAEQLRAARGTPAGLSMASNQRLDVSGEGDTVRVGNATVTQADLRASNGVVHVVDAVITGGGAAAAAPPASAPTTPAAPAGPATPQN